MHKAKLRQLNVNDIVYLKSTDKFKPRFTGPFQILCKHSPVSFSIQRQYMPSSKQFRVHIDRLILAPSRQPHLLSSTHTNSPVEVAPHNVIPYNLRPRL